MGDDCKIWNWNIAKNSANCVNICKGHTQHIETLRVSHDKTLMATAAWDKTIRIWTTCKYPNIPDCFSFLIFFYA